MAEAYPDKTHFHKVIPLHEHPDVSWEEFSVLAPQLPRGWFELAHLGGEDRKNFLCDYWLTKLPFHSVNGLYLEERIEQFFARVEEVGIFVLQATPAAPFEVHMIYGLVGNESFFHGAPPATEEVKNTLVRQFAHLNLPVDYLAFLEVHNGFSKVTDTGVLPAREVPRTFQQLQHLLKDVEMLGPDGEVINPTSLIPFYESYGLHCYQCFYADWYPDDEMGNVYFSSVDQVISDISVRDRLEENLAFPTFVDWLVFYLEDILEV